MFIVEVPYPVITGLDGKPLEDGYVYFGTINMNPETAPITVYWDVAGTQPALQPIRTINGYFSRNGHVGKIYSPTDYSITVKDRNGALVYTKANSDEVDAIEADDARLDALELKSQIIKSIVIDYEADPTGDDDSTGSFNDAGAANGIVLVPEGSYSVTGTADMGNTKLIGDSLNLSIVELATAVTTDYGFHLDSYMTMQDLTINHTASTTGTVNGRSNCSILIGAALPSSDEISEFVNLKNIKINYNDTGGFAGNTVAGFGNVHHCSVDNLYITTNSKTGFQLHWGYNAASTRTNHPRHTDIHNLTVIGDVTTTTGYYLSGCHDIRAFSGLIKDCNQGVIVGTGDVGGGKDPQNESVDLIMGGLFFNALTIENCVNEAFLFQGASFVLGVEEDFPNQRWIAADYYTTGAVVRDCRVIKEAASTNNTAAYIEHMRNVEVINMTVGLKSGFQDTETTEAFTLLASNDCKIEAKTNCVVAVNAISGRNNHIDIDHVNSDIDNTTSQNGITIRGEIVSAIIDEDVAINDDFVIIRELTCDIHKGMKFFRSGVFYEFDGHARFDNNPTRDARVRVPIKPATATLPSGGTILQFYCAHDIVIDGRIEGMNKGVRIISSDARVPYNIEINADFKDSVVCDIEAPLGILVKYKGTYYYDDAGGTMTITNGVASPSTVISYDIVNNRKIGFSSSIPNNGSWVKGDLLINNNPSTSSTYAWRCTTAGDGGAAVFETLAF